MGKKVEGRLEREGTHVYLWLIHVDVWQKPTQFCKTIILQVRNKYFFKKRLCSLFKCMTWAETLWASLSVYLTSNPDDSYDQFWKE